MDADVKLGSDIDYGATPERLLDLSVTDLYTLPSSQVAEIQLAGLRTRFASLVDKVTTLGRLADEQGVKEIESIEQGALLLFPHSLYKSYPISLLEKGRFDRLTRWLDGLTSLDLSNIDVSGCDTIDEWVQALDANSDIRVIHSGGTTGKLSFLPRSTLEVARSARGFMRYYEGFGDEPNSPPANLNECPVIIPNYRYGAMGQARLLGGLAEHLYGGDESMIITLSNGRLSADMLSLAGRLKVAESRGDHGMVNISPKLMAKREEYLKEQEGAAARRAAFFQEVAERFRGKRVILLGHWHQHYEVAVEALSKGIEKVFAPDSFMNVAGGMKGRTLPEGFQDIIKRYLGVERFRAGYGMSEIVCMQAACAEGRFHIPPFVIPYVLDPKSGAPLPRTGLQKGRYGFIDLMAETYWGGFLTGDEVTLNWGDKEPCGCGRLGPFIHDDIRRYSEQEGGDDKITCAGAPEAHDKALAFLSELA